LKIPHVLLTNGTLILSEPRTVTLTPRSLNYQSILKTLAAGDLAQLTSLLDEKPVDGLWYAYDSSNTLKLMHIPAGFGYPQVYTLDGNATRLDQSDVFLGTFGSRDALIAAYPEYFI
jgi:hypothetical protein